MTKFTENDVLHGKYYSLWLNGDLRGEVKTASAETALKTEEIPIAGQLGSGIVITGATGTGALTFYKIFGNLAKDINAALKKGKPFIFDLISELTDADETDSERVIIEDCKITKFKVIDEDISKLLDQSFDFSYNPNKVTFEN
jgi:hypothetical protein